jgi:hypothetical protein
MVIGLVVFSKSRLGITGSRSVPALGVISLEPAPLFGLSRRGREYREFTTVV